MANPKAPDQLELEYLGELLATFGTKNAPATEEALKRVRVRYTVLSRGLVGRLEGDELVPVAAPVGLNPIRAIHAKTIHGFLFDGILSNAGKYRLESEPNGGTVMFGGTAHQGVAALFTGTHPSAIPGQLERAFVALYENPDPVAASAGFYVAFSRIHPFYDANGRIARLLVSLFLLSHGFYPDWNGLQPSKGKFINKINNCHKRAGQPSFEKYLGYFESPWRRHVRRIDQFYSESLEPPGDEAS